MKSRVGQVWEAFGETMWIIVGAPVHKPAARVVIHSALVLRQEPRGWLDETPGSLSYVHEDERVPLEEATTMRRVV